MRPLLTIPQWRESSSTLLLTGDSGCSNSLCSLNDLMIKELVSSWLAEMNILALYLAFSDTTLARVLECLITELQEWTSGSPLYFAGMNVPMFFVCGLLLQYSSCLKVFCFSRLPSNPITFLVLWPEREAFFGLFFFLIHTYWHFQVAGFFSSKSGIYETKQNNEEPISLVPRSLLICLLSNFKSPLVIVLYMTFMGFSCTYQWE